MKYLFALLALSLAYGKDISYQDLKIKDLGYRYIGSIKTKVISFGGYNYPSCKLAISLDGKYFFLKKMHSNCIKFTNSKGLKVICNYNKSVCKTRDELKRFVYNSTNYNSNSMPKIKIKQGMKYSIARKILLDSGWQASYSRWQDIPEYGRAKSYYYDYGWREVEDCSGTGKGYCLFKFHDAYGHKLEVVTTGDKPNKVDNWRVN